MSDLKNYLIYDFNIDEDVIKLVDECERKIGDIFKHYENIAQINQLKVLKAFKKNRISQRHFNPSTGYGYGDEGRDKLFDLFADVFKAEAAIASPLIMSGTHAIGLVLFGLLRPNDYICFATGKPYDTLMPVINGSDSLSEFGVIQSYIPLKINKIDIDTVISELNSHNIKMCYIQRSTGYDVRSAFTNSEIKEAINKIKAFDNKIIIMVDNCYGEFVDVNEPLEVGADIIAGSLIKNPGGGLASTGGYIAGRKDLIEKVAAHYSAPGVGIEIGSYAYGYRLFYQGLFTAPHIVLQALKSVILAAAVFEKLGFEVSPKFDDLRGDITQTLIFNDERILTAFIRSIQSISPIDSFAVPYAWDMPGYDDKVIMAAGTFVQGASAELTADAPIRKPYCAYLQGALTYEHAKIGILNSLNALKHENLI